MTNEQNETGFDYNTWREQGQNALNALQARRDALVAELASVDKQVKEVKKTIGAKKDGPQRFRIKPLISEILKGKETVPVGAIISNIMAAKAGATEDQIISALNRYVHEFSNVQIVDGSVVIG